MELPTLCVLLVEDNPTDVLLVETAFEEMAGMRADVVAVERLSSALALLQDAEERDARFDCILLDLNLPDSQGVDAFPRIAACAPITPVIALTGLADEARAIAALQLGASDYLVKGQSDAPVLERSIRYAIERRKTENQRVELVRAHAAQAEAEEASRAKDIFLATLSHELRTPLNAILGWAHLMSSGSLSEEEKREAVEVIERNARAQVRLVEDLLEVSRFITGKIHLHKAEVEFDKVVVAAIESVRPQALEKEIALLVETEPVVVTGDSIRLQQVIWNLLANATKFTPEGGKVEVLLSQSATHAQLQVRDSGEGISPEFLPHVFERFRQADGSSSRVHGGLGLGLAIAHNIVEVHGGTISVFSEGEGKGATFTVEIPLAQTAASTV